MYAVSVLRVVLRVCCAWTASGLHASHLCVCACVCVCVCRVPRAHTYFEVCVCVCVSCVSLCELCEGTASGLHALLDNNLLFLLNIIISIINDLLFTTTHAQVGME